MILVLSNLFNLLLGDENVGIMRCTNIRSALVHNQVPNLRCGEPFERFSIEEMLQRPEFYNYSLPFVMTGSIDGYEPLKDLDWLVKMFGDNIADFFPFNELDIENHPLFLFRFKAGVAEFKKMPGEGMFGDDEVNSNSPNPGKYLQVGLSPMDWSKLPIYVHVWLRQEFYTCLNTELMNEFFIKTHWKGILIGQPGAGMFNHYDSLRSSSWHLHVTGRKWWRVCKDDTCFEEILNEGDNLFYPKDYLHQTQCLDMPTITLTSTLLTKENKDALIHELWLECVYSKYGYRFSGKLCDALQMCYHSLHHPIDNWRDHASSEHVAEKDSPDAWMSHYDFNTILGDDNGAEAGKEDFCED